MLTVGRKESEFLLMQITLQEAPSEFLLAQITFQVKDQKVQPYGSKKSEFLLQITL